MSADIGQLEFQKQGEKSAQRVFWLAGMTAVTVVLLAATSVLYMERGTAPAEIAAAEPVTRPVVRPDSPVAQVAPPATDVTQDTGTLEPVTSIAAPVPTQEIASEISPDIEPDMASDPALERAYVDAGVCAQELTAVARFSTIYFDAGSSLLDMDDLLKARQLAEALRLCPDLTLQVWGHADGSGDDESNLAISQKRAENTLAALAAMGFDTSLMKPLAAGASLPMAQGDTDEALDRRVEFRIVPAR